MLGRRLPPAWVWGWSCVSARLGVGVARGLLGEVDVDRVVPCHHGGAGSKDTGLAAKRRSKAVPDTAAVKAGTPLRGCSLDSACANGGYTRHSMSDAAKRPWAIPPSPIAWPWVTTVGRPCDGRQRGRLGPAVSDARASPGDGRQRGRLETASETAVFGCSRQPRRLGLTRAVCAASPVWKLLGPARSMDQPAAWARQSSHPDSVP